MAKLIVPQEVRKDPLIHKKSNKTPVNTDSIEAMTPETDKKVTGTFINVECPGQPAKVSGKFYKNMEYFSEVFLDGSRYTVPWSIARFINERCQHSKHDYITDQNGNPIKGNKFFPRYKFMIESMAA
jgi:hypothetical protein